MLLSIYFADHIEFCEDHDVIHEPEIFFKGRGRPWGRSPGSPSGSGRRTHEARGDTVGKKFKDVFKTSWRVKSI